MEKITLANSNSYSKLSKNLKAISILGFCLFVNLGLVHAQVDIADNGSFETGDFTGWEQTLINGTQTVGAFDPTDGAFAANLNNDVLGTASLIKNANKGVGIVNPGDNLTVSFDARGAGEVGGVAFAEVFSELTGGGVSDAVILGGGPLALDPDPTVWTPFEFTVIAGSDVSGGITLQLNATTGGAAGSLMNVFFDNIKIIDEDALSVNENTFNAQNLKLYPNPALNEVTLNNAQSIALEQISLYDFSGRLLQTIDGNTTGTETTLDVSSLVTGTYLVMIETETGKITKQFIKE